MLGLVWHYLINGLAIIGLLALLIAGGVVWVCRLAAKAENRRTREALELAGRQRSLFVEADRFWVR